MRFFKLSITLFIVAIFLFSCFSCAGPSPAVVNTPVNTPANTIANKGTSAEPPLSLPPMDDLADARKMYTEVCAKCHQANGEGGPVTIDGKSFKAPDFKRPGIVNAPDADLVKTITSGDDDMPAFGKRLSPQQINDLVRMIRTDFQGK
jgi:mono/diheme cytochrome c family protein